MKYFYKFTAFKRMALLIFSYLQSLSHPAPLKTLADFRMLWTGGDSNVPFLGSKKGFNIWYQYKERFRYLISVQYSVELPNVINGCKPAPWYWVTIKYLNEKAVPSYFYRLLWSEFSSVTLLNCDDSLLFHFSVWLHIFSSYFSAANSLFHCYGRSEINISPVPSLARTKIISTMSLFSVNYPFILRSS